MVHFALTLFLVSCSTSQKNNSQLYAEFVERVQQTPVYEDSKYFVDMTPRKSPEEILRLYHEQSPKTKEELKSFVEANFSGPNDSMTSTVFYRNVPLNRHIKKLWSYLKRKPDQQSIHSSLIPLPYSYIVPGGRFREIYYWDSYFTQLGLLADDEVELFNGMVNNFSYLLNTLGRIPNGNREYYLGRSQPPFFSYMVALWRDRFGDTSAVKFLPDLIKEHNFWMNGDRAVNLEDGVLNRYWDDYAQPRPEAFKEDVKLAEEAQKSFKIAKSDVYRDLRAAAESGWDFSTRWFKNPLQFATISTTDYVPVDLNSLLYHLEFEIADLSRISGDSNLSARYFALASKRRELIRRYLWDANSETFRDYNWRTKSLSRELTAATVVPLFCGVADDGQAEKVATQLKNKLLKPGGVVTTLLVSGHQWDAPNGWAPLQWMAYAGLKRYHHNSLAEQIRRQWMKLNERVYKTSGKMLEKYNVVDVELKSGGGEYPLQDGFGWTNGVYRALSTTEKSLKHLSK